MLEYLLLNVAHGQEPLLKYYKNIIKEQNQGTKNFKSIIKKLSNKLLL